MIQDVCQLFGQRICTKEISRQRRIYGTCGEKFLFGFETFFDWNIVDDIFLASVFDTDVSVSERNLLIFENITSIITSVHDIDFSETTDRPFS